MFNPRDRGKSHLTHSFSFQFFNIQGSFQAYLVLLLAVYEFLSFQKQLSKPDDQDDDNDPGATMWDAIGSWLTSSQASHLFPVSLLALGAYWSLTQEPKSTFFCRGQGSKVVTLLQWIGILLDAVIITTAWRIIAWARTIKSRLQTVTAILLGAAILTGLISWTSPYVHTKAATYDFKGLGSLYLFDIIVDGLVLSAFLISTTLVVEESTPLSLVATITFITGLSAVIQQILRTGTWEAISPFTTWLAFNLVCVGFSSFLFTYGIRSVLFIPRLLLVFALISLTISATIYIPLSYELEEAHPLRDIIFDSRKASDRFRINAAMSDSLRVAIEVYKERNHGRDPPKGFDLWFNYDNKHRSAIIDHFPQIENDILPFWGMSPSEIREGVRRAAQEPDIAILQIKNGQPQHNLPSANPYKAVMDDLVEAIKAFAEHLPDMELAVNMDERPRVLVPWEEVNRRIKAAKRGWLHRLLPRDVDVLGEMTKPQPSLLGDPQANGNFTSAKALREMTALACPPGTAARAGTYWDTRDLCIECTRPQSVYHFLLDWDIAQDICHQPDLFRLHSFYMTPPELKPLQQLLPVFSRAKTNSYSDILLPLRRISENSNLPSDGFNMKWKGLAWRGKVNRHESSRDHLHGGHQERLVHIFTGASKSDRTRIMLPVDDKRYGFEDMPTTEVNSFLPTDVGFVEYKACNSKDKGGCEVTPESEPQSKPDLEVLRYQYVMVMDTDNGPPRDFLRVLRSSSAPFVASIFKEWYSDRLMPWVHFVPIDLRFHALHSTLAYFTGLQSLDGTHTKKDKSEGNDKDQDNDKKNAAPIVNGRKVLMEGRPGDGKWIAEEGRRWASRAIRKEDEQIYLFRLLLEWGRVTNDNRDELGFVLSS